MDSMETCTHITEVRVSAHPESVSGCEDCLQIGGHWRHLRVCLTCGHVACCDASPNHHARRHWEETHHPIIQSVEPGEQWAWCYSHSAYIRRLPGA